ncbi:MAG: hypothetical protein AAB886_02830, partial [Patescibacteria group bacterium]
MYVIFFIPVPCSSSHTITFAFASDVLSPLRNPELLETPSPSKQLVTSPESGDTTDWTNKSYLSAKAKSLSSC